MKALAFLISGVLAAGHLSAEPNERSYVASFACSRNNLTGKTFDTPGVLVVHVFDWSGEPLPGAEIRVSRGKSLAVKSASDTDGRVVAKDLLDGSYTVVVTMPGFLRGESKPAEIRRGCTSAMSVPLQVADPSHSSLRGMGH